MYFLISAVLEKAAATNSNATIPPSDWRSRYEAMAKRRRGNIPVWLLDAAKKLGLQLPSVSLTCPSSEASTQPGIHCAGVPNSAALPEHL